MKLYKLLLINACTALIAGSNDQNGNGSLLNHKPGEGSIFENIFMHTIGHVISDLPDYLATLAKGDIFGVITKLLRFALYHNSINILSDFGGGQVAKAIGGGGGDYGGGGGHNH